MESEIKSFKNYIKQQVALFSYEDFQPPIQVPQLRKKFEDIILKECAYWRPLEVGPQLQANWSLIELKSFRDRAFMFGVRISRSDIQIIQYKEFQGFNDSPAVRITMPEIFVDHGKLVDFLAKYLGKAIACANADTEQALNWD